MADITTVEGLRVLFDPTAISAIVDSDGRAGAAGSVIYGLAPEGLEVSETMDALLRRLSLTASFARLTRPDGSPVLINGKAVSVARQPAPAEYAAEVRAVIFAGTLQQAVREPLEQVRQAIDAAGGNL